MKKTFILISIFMIAFSFLRVFSYGQVVKNSKTSESSPYCSAFSDCSMSSSQQVICTSCLEPVYDIIKTSEFIAYVPLEFRAIIFIHKSMEEKNFNSFLERPPTFLT